MPDWLLTTLFWLLLALGTSVVLWALFADWVRQRFRHRRRCPKCWYDLSHSPGMTCSECGYTAKRERKLHKARRRWRWAFASMVPFVGVYFVNATPDIRERGWVAAVPTTLLVLLAPMEDEAWEQFDESYLGRNGSIVVGPNKGDALLEEVFLRFDHREPWSWQWRTFWNRFYNAFPDQLDRLVVTREQWPRDMPIKGHLWAPWPLVVLRNETDLLVRARIGGSGEPWVVRDLSDRSILSDSDEDFTDPQFGLPEAGRRSLKFEIEIYANVRADPSGVKRDVTDATLIWRGHSRTVSIGGEVNDVMSPVRSTTGDRNIRSLKPTLSYSAAGRIELSLWLRGHHLGDLGEGDWALGADVTILCNQHAVATAKLLYPMTQPGVRGTLIVHETLIATEWSIDPAECPSDGEWEIILRSNPAVALYDVERDAYWEGEIRMPLNGITVSQSASRLN